MRKNMAISVCAVLIGWSKNPSCHFKGRALLLPPLILFAKCYRKWECHITLESMLGTLARMGCRVSKIYKRDINLEDKCISVHIPLKTSHALFFCPEIQKWWVKYMPFLHDTRQHISFVELAALVKIEVFMKILLIFLLIAWSLWNKWNKRV